MNNNLHLEKQEIANILLILVISISFLLLPWIKISEFFSITPLSGIFQFFNVLNNTDLNFNLNAANFALIVYLVSLYLILLFAAIAVFYLVRDHNNYQFNFYCKIDYIVNIVLCIVSIILKYVISNWITDEINANGFGLGGYVGSLIDSVFTFGAGFYVILVCSAFGILLPYLFRSLNSQNSVRVENSPNIPNNWQGERGENVNVKPADYTSQPQEYPGNVSEQSMITLVGSTNVPINELPSVIGRNRELVNTVINEPSVSRVHCRLEERNGNILITDLGSSFGTAVNDVQLDKYQSIVVKNNDILRLGDIRFRILINNNYNVPSYLSETVSEKSIINNSSNNSLNEDYVSHSAGSPKLYTEEFIVKNDGSSDTFD